MNIKINNSWIGLKQPTYIIAEIGINHNQDYFLAKRLIEMAKKCNANAVKFQIYYGNKKLQREFGFEPIYMDKLIDYTRKNKLDLIITPFDLGCLDYIEKWNVDAIKIGSGQAPDNNFVNNIFERFQDEVPIIISSGILSEDLIWQYVGEFSPFFLLHTISHYPTKLHEAQLNTIEYMRVQWSNQVVIGYSDHTRSILACLSAISKGANLLEAHITMDLNMAGPDHIISYLPKEFAYMVEAIKQIDKLAGQFRIPKEREIIYRKREDILPK